MSVIIREYQLDTSAPSTILTLPATAVFLSIGPKDGGVFLYVTEPIVPLTLEHYTLIIVPSNTAVPSVNGKYLGTFTVDGAPTFVGHVFVE